MNLEQTRLSKGYLTHQELELILSKDNFVYDYGSVLISKHAILGSGNEIYHNVIIDCDSSSRILIGSGNKFYPGTHIVARGGSVVIGNNSEIGESGFIIKANIADSAIVIGDCVRCNGGGAVYGLSNLGNGSQVLGLVSVYSCNLGEGNSYTSSDPDMRGGVIKGIGTIRSLTIPVGHVANVWGTFDNEKIEKQANYHKQMN